MKYFFTYIFLLGLCTSNNNLLAQSTFDSQKEEADSLFEVKEYLLAATLYEKVLFEYPTSKQKNQTYLKRIESLVNANEHERAAYEASSFFLMDSVSKSIRYYEALSQYLSGNVLLANLAIQKYDNLPKNSDLVDIDMLRLKAIAFSESKKFEELEKLFNSKEFSNSFNSEQCLQWLNEYKSLKYKKTERAEWYSTFVPGLGQVYAGKFAEGAASFILNSSGLFFMGYNFWQTNYFTTFTVGSALLNKFYFGGRRRAHFLVEQRNKELKAKDLEQLLSLMK